MSRYLVTGGAGFIGSHLCDRLLAGGHAVRVIDDLSTGLQGNLSGRAELRVGDAADSALVRSALDGIDGVFHLAAIASADRVCTDRLGSHRANQTAALVVLDAARARTELPVVLASSAAVYGDNDDLPLKEIAAPAPLSAYGADKLGCELHARAAWESDRVPTAALRIFNAFGARQSAASPYSGVVANFAARLMRDKAPIIFGDGQQTRDFIHVGDVVRHLEAAMASLVANPRALVCNVCTGHPVSIAALARHVAEALHKTWLTPDFAPPRAREIRHSCGDPSVATQALGVRAQTSLRRGLLAMLDDAACARERFESAFS